MGTDRVRWEQTVRVLQQLKQHLAGSVIPLRLRDAFIASILMGASRYIFKMVYNNRVVFS